MRVDHAVALLHLGQRADAVEEVERAVAAQRAAANGGARKVPDLLDAFASALDIVGDKAASAGYAARAEAARREAD
ncbi:MAG: hypothetical protein JWO31_1378 [Phycisphaerales bacterium]|nr:hypothetical protein [Phycisphaerales bacterium]